jgi:hypothetical protein
MLRTDIPPGWDERTILTTFLDYVRATVHAKCEHLAEVDARRARFRLPAYDPIGPGVADHATFCRTRPFTCAIVRRQGHAIGGESPRAWLPIGLLGSGPSGVGSATTIPTSLTSMYNPPEFAPAGEQ